MRGFIWRTDMQATNIRYIWGDNISFKRFDMHGHAYLYDVATNQIVSLAGDLAAALDTATASRGAIVGSLAEVREQLDPDIAEMIDAGMLVRQRNAEVTKPYCDCCYDNKVAGQMEQLVLESTEQCNLRCRYCCFSGAYAQQRCHGSRHMSFEMMRKAIDYFCENSSRQDSPTVSFYGGEPTLNWLAVSRAIDHILSLPTWRDRVLVTIDTNGFNVSNEKLAFLMDRNVSLQVSLDGPLDIHDTNRIAVDGAPSWARVMDFLARVRERDPHYFKTKVVLACTICPPYEVERIVEFFETDPLVKELPVVCGDFEEEGVDSHSVFGAACGARTYSEGFTPALRRYDAAVKEGRRGELPLVLSSMLDRVFIRFFGREISPLGNTLPPNGICSPGIRRHYVDVEGNYHICEKVGRDNPIGHIDSGLDKSRIEVLLDTYRDHCQQLCNDCWAARICSMCFATVMRDGRISLEKRREECETERSVALGTITRFLDAERVRPGAYNFVKEIMVK